MPSFLDQTNNRRGQQRVGGLTVQVAPGARQFATRPAPARGNSRAGGGGGSQLDQLLGAFATTPEAQKRAEDEARKEAEANQSVWGKGLGVVFGNPLAKGLFQGLEYLSYPRRFIQAGIVEPILEGGGFIEKDSEDNTLWDKVTDKDYGFGQIINRDGETNGAAERWTNRLLGFAGDVGMDPLTYVTGGATKAVEGAEAAAAGAKALQLASEASVAERALARAGRAAEVAGTLGREGMVDDYLELAQRAALAGDEAAAAQAAHLAAREAPGGLRTVRAMSNRAGRLGELGETALRNPELIAQNEAEFARIAAGGYGAARSQAVREGLGLRDPALRFMGKDIPGTAWLGEGLERAGAGIRTSLNRTGLSRLSRGPLGMEGATARLLGREGTVGQGQVLRDITNIGMANAIREGGEVQLRGNRLLTALTKGNEGMGRMSPEARAALVQAAETPGEVTPLNEFFDSMATIYRDVSGKDVRRLAGAPDGTYVPHMLTPRFRRFLKAGGEGTGDFMKAAGFATDDLLEGSGYIEKARKLVPGARIEIGGQTIQLGDGTITDLNDKLRQAFPNFTGKFYEDDPIRIGEAYIDSLAKGAGKQKALGRFADSENPLVRRVAGDLEASRTELNENLARQDPLYDALRGGTAYDEGPVPPAPRSLLSDEARADRAAVGDVEPTDFFKVVPDERATEERAAWLTSRRGGRAEVKAAGAERDAEFAALVEDVKNTRTDLANRMLEVKEAATPEIPSRIYAARIKKLEQQLDKVEARLLETKSATAPAEARQELAELLVRNAEQQREITEALARQQRIAAQQAGKQKASKLRALEGHLETLKAQEARAYSMISDPTPMQDAIAARLAELNGPLDQAKRSLQQAVDEYPMRHAPEDVARARQIVNKADAGAPTADRTLTRARKILREEAEDRRGLQEATKAQRNRVELAEFQRARRPSLGPVRTPSRTFEAAETEEATLRAVRAEIENVGARRGTAGRATVRREEFERSMINRQDQVRKEVRLGLEERKQQLLDAAGVERGEVRTQRRLGEAKARSVIKPHAERIKIINQEIDGLNTAIAHNRVEMEAVRAQEQRVRDLSAGIQKMSTDVRKVETMKQLDRQVLTPMRQIAEANPDLGDEVLNQVEVLLDDAADRMLKLSAHDLRDGEVRKLIKAAENGKLAPVMMAVLNDQWKLMHEGLIGQGDIFVDRQLADQFNLLFELRKEPMLFGRTLNAMTNLFKTYATLSPGFHVRNALGAVFMNTSDGVALSAQHDAVGLWRKFAKEGEEWLARQPEEVRGAFTAIGATGAGGRFTESGVAETIDATKFGSSAYNKLASNRITRASQRAGNAVEGVVRLGMALDSLRNGETVQGAIQRISRVHFDYGLVSRMDEQAKRVIPFWTFMSRNLPLQVSQMWSKPRAYAIYESFVRNFAAPSLPYTPEYWTDSGAWNSGATVPGAAGPAGGLPIYIQPDLGFTRLQSDVEDIEDALSGDNPGGLLSSVNPFLTAPLEYITRTDFFTGQQFPEGEGFEKQGGLLGVPITALARLTGNTDEGGRVDPRFMNVLNAVNPLQGRAERLTPQLTGGDDEAKRRQLESIARFLGLPVRTLTQQQQDNEYLRRYYTALEEMSRQRELAGAS